MSNNVLWLMAVDITLLLSPGFRPALAAWNGSDRVKKTWTFEYVRLYVILSYECMWSEIMLLGQMSGALAEKRPDYCGKRRGEDD